jgi:hypothetical protein
MCKGDLPDKQRRAFLCVCVFSIWGTVIPVLKFVADMIVWDS